MTVKTLKDMKSLDQLSRCFRNKKNRKLRTEVMHKRVMCALREITSYGINGSAMGYWGPDDRGIIIKDEIEYGLKKGWINLSDVEQNQRAYIFGPAKDHAKYEFNQLEQHAIYPGCSLGGAYDQLSALEIGVNLGLFSKEELIGRMVSYEIKEKEDLLREQEKKTRRQIYLSKELSE